MEERYIVGDSVLEGIEQKRISENRSVKVRIFPSATTHDMYDYLKPLLKSIQTTLFCILEPIIQ